MPSYLPFRGILRQEIAERFEKKLYEIMEYILQPKRKLTESEIIDKIREVI